jgi:hypothetical protein
MHPVQIAVTVSTTTGLLLELEVSATPAQLSLTAFSVIKAVPISARSAPMGIISMILEHAHLATPTALIASMTQFALAASQDGP